MFQIMWQQQKPKNSKPTNFQITKSTKLSSSRNKESLLRIRDKTLIKERKR